MNGLGMRLICYKPSSTALGAHNTYITFYDIITELGEHLAVSTAKKNWLPWLQTNWGDSSYKRFMLVNIKNAQKQKSTHWKSHIPTSFSHYSNLSPNHTLQLTTWTSLRESLQLQFKISMLLMATLTDVQWLHCKKKKRLTEWLPWLQETVTMTY